MNNCTDVTDLPAVLTIDELAKLLRLNRKTVYEAVYKNEIPGIQRIGRQYRASREVVLAWLASGCNGGENTRPRGRNCTRGAV